MLDVFGLPDIGDRQQSFSHIGGTSAAPRQQTWHKPRGIGMVHIMSIDPGSGGGGGFSGATSTQRGGGGSGTSGVVVSLLIPALFIPDLVYIFVAPGTAGGAAAQAAGNPGSNSVFAYAGVTAAAYAAILTPQSGGPGGGGAGTATTGGTADGAESAGPAANGSFLSTGIGMFSSAGTSGGNAGSASGAGNACNPSKMISCVMPGAGGAGCTSGNVDSAGGAIVGNASMPWVLAGIPGGLAGGGRGQDGFMLRSPMLFLGGTGGGSNSSGTGGAGGNGAIGCGGGGGGGGVTGGKGGDGGNGLVIITCF